MLPPELISECVRLIFPTFYFDSGAVPEKPNWKDVEGISMTSKASRQILLEIWFRALRISDVEDRHIIQSDWQQLYGYTRAVHLTPTVYWSPKYLLEHFDRLDTLRIDLPFAQETEEDFDAPQIQKLISRTIPSTIQHLEIRGITWLDPSVMRHIAEGLPNLRTLRLRQPLVWCNLCNRNDAPSFVSMPPKIVYNDSSGLPDAYSRSLAPLQYLHTVILTVACDEGGMEYDTLFSYPAIPRDVGNRPFLRPLSIQDADVQARIGWSGECAACMVQLLLDKTLYDSWWSKSAARASIPGDSVNIGQPSHPPSLRRIEWNLLDMSEEYWPGIPI